MRNNLEIGNRIRVIREELCMSRNVFSEKINISESYLAQLELGNKSLGMNTLISLCEYTGYSADYFLFGNESTQDLSQKIVRIVNRLPENALRLELMKCFALLNLFVKEIVKTKMSLKIKTQKKICV